MQEIFGSLSVMSNNSTGSMLTTLVLPMVSDYFLFLFSSHQTTEEKG